MPELPRPSYGCDCRVMTGAMVLDSGRCSGCGKVVVEPTRQGRGEQRVRAIAVLLETADRLSEIAAGMSSGEARSGLLHVSDAAVRELEGLNVSQRAQHLVDEHGAYTAKAFEIIDEARARYG